MKENIFVLVVLLFPYELAMAAEKSLTRSLIENLIPIILFIGVWFYLMRGTNDSTKGVVESNDRLTEQIKRIADHLEKNS